MLAVCKRIFIVTVVGATMAAFIFGATNAATIAVDFKPAEDAGAYTPFEGATVRLSQAYPQVAESDTLTSGLPNGASSLQERYEDWLVVCSGRTEKDTIARRCAVSQQQASQQTGQRILSMELSRREDGLEASLFLPFGLILNKGVTLQVDSGEASQPFPFRTCRSVGCVVPLWFDASYVAVLKQGATLKLTAIADGEVASLFTISLKGFGAAVARLNALTE